MLSKLWQVLLKLSDKLLVLLDTPGKWLFGRDIFISYARADAAEYAAGLAKQLSKDYSCYLDQWASPRGTELPRPIRRAVYRSSMLVLVGTSGAINSQFVKLEFGRFVKTGRPLIPINIAGELNAAPWEEEPWSKIHRVSQAIDTEAAKFEGKPSPRVVNYIKDSADFTRQNQRLRVIAGGTAAFVVIALGGTLAWSTYRVSEANRKVAEQTQKAGEAEERAVNANAGAEAARQNAENSNRNANLAEGRARDANAQAQNANLRAVNANARAGAAEARATNANMRATQAAAREKEATASALKQRTIARARLVAAQSDLAHNSDSTELERNMLLSIESLKRDYSLEAYRNVLAGLKLLPRSKPRPISHTQDVEAVRYSPDGKVIATLEGDTVLLWRANDWTRATLSLKHDQAVSAIAFSREGKYMATSSGDTVRIWEVGTGRELPPVRHGSPVKCIAFSPDQRYVALAGCQPDEDKTKRLKQHAARVVEIEPRREVASLPHAAEVSSIAFHPDGKSIATLSDETVQVWSTSGDWQTNPREFSRKVERASSIDFSPDGKYLLCRSDDMEHSIYMWRASADYEEVSRFDKINTLQADFSPNGQYLVTVDEDPFASTFVTVWDITGRQPRPVTSFGDHAKAFTFSPDGNYLAVESFSQVAGGENLGETVQVYSAADWRLLAHIITGTELDKDRIALSPDGLYLLAGVGKEVQVWEVTNTGWNYAEVEAEGPAEGDAPVVALSPDGRRLASVFAKNGVQVFQTDESPESPKDRPVRFDKPPFYRQPLPVEEIVAMSFTHDGKSLAVVGNNYVAYSCHLDKDGPCQPLRLPEPKVYDIAFSGDGKRMAIAADGHVLVQDVSGGNPVRVGVDASLTAFALSYKGDYLATTVDDQIQVWSVAQNSPVAAGRHPLGTYGANTRVAFSDDGDYLFTADHLNASMWDLRLKKKLVEVARFNMSDEVGGKVKVMLASLSINGRYLAATARVSGDDDTKPESAARTLVWSWQPKDLSVSLCHRLMHSISEEDWEDYFSGEKYGRPCPNLPLPGPSPGAGR
jgi:WD40 repeat protein